MITYLQAKQILAKYVGNGGRCIDDPDVDLFVKKVLQYLLLQGATGNERTFSFHAENGCITLPKDLETPLKMKIGTAVGSVWNRWFEYHSGTQVDNCCLAQESLLTQPNRYPTVYDLPSCGAFPGVVAICEESQDAYVIVKGLDLTGREIITVDRGEQIVGERLWPCKGKLVKAQVKFGKITEVYKTKTKGYITLVATDECGTYRKFLSDYTPFEETPSYQRVRIISQPCPPCCEVKIIGRIKLKDYYADEDVIPFDNLYLLDVAGQAVNNMGNDKVQDSLAKDNYVKSLIETESNYKKVNNGQPLEIFRPLSGGTIVNAARKGRFLRGWR